MPADMAWQQALTEDRRLRCFRPGISARAAADIAISATGCCGLFRGLPELTQAPAGAIIYGEDICADALPRNRLEQGGGIALKAGSTSSHVAMLARSRGVPMVVGIGAEWQANLPAQSLDGHGGIVLTALRPSIELSQILLGSILGRRDRAGGSWREPAVTKAGTRCAVQVNIADPSDVDGIDIATCDGVGLMRTEFLVRQALPDEETQYRAYRKAAALGRRPAGDDPHVDAGGDKPVPGYTVAGEANPFLGLRGIRLSLARPEVFRVQIRALLRAAGHWAAEE
jgi:phosphotransferase system enzyme I (PtsI)